MRRRALFAGAAALAVSIAVPTAPIATSVEAFQAVERAAGNSGHHVVLYIVNFMRTQPRDVRDAYSQRVRNFGLVEFADAFDRWSAKL